MDMATQKNTRGTGELPALRLGSRVRCTDDGVAGRIVWANAVAVKVKWDDGEQVTWKRDSLTDRPIEILDADGEDQAVAPPTAAAPPAAEPTELPREAAEATTAAPEAAGTGPEVPAPQPAATESTTPAPEPPAAEPVSPVPEPPPAEAATGTTGAPASVPAQPKRQRKAPAAPKEKKVSALDAAARVLAEEGRPMSCPELIAAMAARGYWTSPGGQTPAATLYSALARELTTKGAAARFRKVGPGRFAPSPGA
jgi:hypothetical protein